MAGIYNNSDEDRYRERQLDRYLDSQDEPDCDEDEFDRRAAEAEENYNRKRLQELEDNSRY